MSFFYLLVAILPWLVAFGAAVYLIHIWKKPGPDQLEHEEVRQLREEVELMRDFVRDALERIRRLEEARGEGSLTPGEGAEAGRAIAGEEGDGDPDALEHGGGPRLPGGA